VTIGLRTFCPADNFCVDHPLDKLLCAPTTSPGAPQAWLVVAPARH